MAKNFVARMVLLAIAISVFLLLGGCAKRQAHPAIQQQASAGAKNPHIAHMIQTASDGVLNGVYISNKLLEKAGRLRSQDQKVLAAGTHLVWAFLLDTNATQKIQYIYKASNGGYRLKNDTSVYLISISTHNFILQRSGSKLMLGEIQQAQPVPIADKEAVPQAPLQKRLKSAIGRQVLTVKSADGPLVMAPALRGAWQAEQTAQQARQEAVRYTKTKRSIVVNTGLGLSALAAGLILPRQPVVAISLGTIQILYNLWEWWPDSETSTVQIQPR